MAAKRPTISAELLRIQRELERVNRQLAAALKRKSNASYKRATVAVQDAQSCLIDCNRVLRLSVRKTARTTKGQPLAIIDPIGPWGFAEPHIQGILETVGSHVDAIDDARKALSEKPDSETALRRLAERHVTVIKSLDPVWRALGEGPSAMV